jgi:hypothetical protein
MVFAYSCNNEPKTFNDEGLNENSGINDSASGISLDSLDTDTSSYILTNFPDTVKVVLNLANHKLMEWVINSYVTEVKSDTLFSTAYFKKVLISDDFTLDTSENKISGWKSSFNKREQIEYSKNQKEIKVFIQSRFWYSGKKYLLAWLRLLPEKKDETVIDYF